MLRLSDPPVQKKNFSFTGSMSSRASTTTLGSGQRTGTLVLCVYRNTRWSATRSVPSVTASPNAESGVPHEQRQRFEARRRALSIAAVIRIQIAGPENLVH